MKTVSKKFTEAREEYKKLAEQIAPFLKKKDVRPTSTAGMWRNGTSRTYILNNEQK